MPIDVGMSLQGVESELIARLEQCRKDVLQAEATVTGIASISGSSSGLIELRRDAERALEQANQRYRVARRALAEFFVVTPESPAA